MKWFDYIFKNTEPPLWLRRLNYISLAGVIAWPLAAFTSIFLYDNPNSDFPHRRLYFILLNTYPLILLILSFLSFKLSRRSPVLAAILPSIPITAYAIVIGFMFFAG